MRSVADWVEPQKAWNFLVRESRSRDLHWKLHKELLLTPAGTVTLPGFNLLEMEPEELPSWLVPKASKDLDQVWSAWEAFADRPLGKVRYPARVLQKSLALSRSVNYLGRERAGTFWWEPAVLYILAVHKTHGGDLDKSNLPYPYLYLEDFTLGISSRGAWSNFKGKEVRSGIQARDVNPSNLVFPETLSRHALAHACQELPRDLQLAAVVVLRDKGVIAPSELLVTPPEKSFKRLKGFLDGSARSMALTDTRYLLDLEGSTIADVYRVCVPSLITPKEFTAAAGEPSTSKIMSGASRKRLLEVIEHI